MLKIGQKIKAARKIRRITQEELANAMGVSDKSISAYESDRANPPLSVIEKISKVTDQPLSFFLEETIETSILSKLREVEIQFKEIKKLLEKEKFI
ncbi:MAG: helix-turn-helix transcriptional regulator [Candidatus Shapirobacteria bacterium]|jgi:transcriptional regulator with XRE-family HTH domain